MSLNDNKFAMKKVFQVEKEIDLQFNLIRTQMRNV